MNSVDALGLDGQGCENDPSSCADPGNPSDPDLPVQDPTQPIVMPDFSPDPNCPGCTVTIQFGPLTGDMSPDASGNLYLDNPGMAMFQGQAGQTWGAASHAVNMMAAFEGAGVAVVFAAPAAVTAAGAATMANASAALGAAGTAAIGAAQEGEQAVVAVEEETGTVWDAIKATQANFEGSVLPRSFTLETEGADVWVAPNALKHILEQGLSPLGIQEALTSLQAAVGMATQRGVQYGTMILEGGWEMMFNPARIDGDLDVLYHARQIQ